MAISTCQKITFISCMVLCLSLFLPKMFLPREKKEKMNSEVGPGHFPPLRHGYSFSEDQVDWNTESHYTKHYNPEAFSRVKSVAKPNLLVQVIPVYGFGIFLYIIYLFFKLTSKDKPHRQGCRFPILQPERTLEEMPACQLPPGTSERTREKKLSKVVHPSVRSCRGTWRREEKKLKQLREITQMMRERQLREGVTPEEEAEEAPYTADWEGYPEETYPEYDLPCRRRRYPSVILEEPDVVIPTAEELAEQMEKEEEEEEPADNENKDKEEILGENKEENDEKQDEQEEEDEEDEEDNDEDEEEDIGEDQPCLPKSIDEDDEKLNYLGTREDTQKPTRRRQITFSGHRHVFHYPKGGAVGCQYEEEEEEEHEEDEQEDEENEEEDNSDDEDYEEGEDQNNEERQSEREDGKEEDPLMEAESLGFNDDVECDPEEQEVDLIDFLQTYQPEVTIISSQSQSLKPQAPGTLRMRNKKIKVKK